MKIQQIIVTTSEITCVELNPLADKLVVQVPPEFDIGLVNVDGVAHIELTRSGS